jgi:hypothetical protein
MKKIVALLSLLVSAYSMNANALFTRCEIDTTVKSFDVGIELGSGTGSATCWDHNNKKFTTPLAVAIDAGIGVQVGMCEVTAHYSVLGVGFALDNLLMVLGQVEFAPGSGQGVGFGVNLNPLGINAGLNVSSINVTNCLKFADIKGLVMVKSGPSTTAN